MIKDKLETYGTLLVHAKHKINMADAGLQAPAVPAPQAPQQPA